MSFSVLLLAITVLGADERERARDAFESGTEALSTGRFVEAAADFQRCLDLAKSPPCAFNLAVALRGTGDVIAAEGVLEALLTGQWGPLARKRRRQVQKLLDETREQVALLSLVLTPKELPVTVRLDGEIILDGSPPSRAPLRVNPGAHVLLVSAEAHVPVERKLMLEAGAQQSVALALEPVPVPTTGTLIVETTSATDRVEVEGIGVSVGGYTGELEVGTYRLRVSGDGETQEQEIVVEAGSTLRVAVDLQEERSVLASPWFWAGAALVAAGSVGAVLYFTRDEAPPVLRDDVFDVTEALRW